MISRQSDIGEDVRKYCAEIGTDRLLVQGAGGNASWKQGKTLWIKASGKWLANAKKEEIFIPVDLASLKSEIAKQNFSNSPHVIGNSQLRPSIETILHALMPHPVVLHLHAVEVLAHLVKPDCNDLLEKLLSKFVSFAVVDYFKPGANLASEIHGILANNKVNVIFLKNHGVVIGGENISDVHMLLSKITYSLATESKLGITQAPIISKVPKNYLDKYTPISDRSVQQLALNPILYNRLSSDWALYPDHVVFLGPRAHTFQSWEELEIIPTESHPELIFLGGMGVYAKPSFTKAKLVQLRCYFDVMVRQKEDTQLVVLNTSQIGELINWDAEQYRMFLES